MIAAAQHDVAVQPLAAQVEEAVAQPDVLGIFGLAEHRQRQLGRSDSTSISAANTSTSPVGSSGLTVPSGRGRHLAVDPDHPFGAHRLGRAKAGRSGSATIWVRP